MNTTFDHKIIKSIRAYYKRRLIFPVVFFFFLLMLLLFYPMTSLLFPSALSSGKNPDTLYHSRHCFVNASLKNLYFTGYTKRWLDRTTGYYYYTMIDHKCVIVLLSPSTCEQGISSISRLSFRAQILKNSSSTNALLSHLSKDLNWSQDGLLEAVSDYTLSEPDAQNIVTTIFSALFVLTGLYALLSIAVCVLSIAFPVFSQPVRALRVYGSPRKMLLAAEEELSTLPQLATEDMFITAHYFIETSRFGVAIVPISEILWIYKYSTLHKFLWHHFMISYTLYITAGKHLYIRCPKNIKSDIDGIMDYLAEANHNILVGFSEENRRKVEAMQGDFIFFRKLLAFLSKRI